MKPNKIIIMLAFALNAMTAFPQAIVAITNFNGSVTLWADFDAPFAPNSNTNAIIALRDAIGKTNEQARIAEFAKHDDAEIRALAVSKLEDRTLLEKIEKNDPVDFVRRQALVSIIIMQRLEIMSKFIRDNAQDALEFYADEKQSDAKMRLMIVPNLESITLLTKIAKDDSDERIRKAAEARLEELKKEEKAPQ